MVPSSGQDATTPTHGDNCTSWHGWPNECDCGAAPGTTQEAPFAIRLTGAATFAGPIEVTRVWVWRCAACGQDSSFRGLGFAVRTAAQEDGDNHAKHCAAVAQEGES